jgi:hypothetical protein
MKARRVPPKASSSEVTVRSGFEGCSKSNRAVVEIDRLTYATLSG